MISPKFNGSLASAIIGNIVTGAYTGHHTRLQLAMSVLLHSKAVIKQLYEYGINPLLNRQVEHKITLISEQSDYQSVRRRQLNACSINSRKRERIITPSN